MAVYENLPVFKASYDLLLASFKLCSNLPRDYRYTLGERLKTELTDLMICIYRANGSEEKRPYLTEARRAGGGDQASFTVAARYETDFAQTIRLAVCQHRIGVEAVDCLAEKTRQWIETGIKTG